MMKTSSTLLLPLQLIIATDSAVPSENTYEIPCKHIPTHVKVNNGRRQDSVGMDSSEAVYDMPPALDDMNDDDDNCYSLVDNLN